MADIKPANIDYVEHGNDEHLGDKHQGPVIAESNRHADLYAEALEKYGTDDSIDAAAEKALKR
jgi:hypothetical protein